MKICPKCQKNYVDESLNFCLNDGSALMSAVKTENALPETVFINQPRSTNPPDNAGRQPDFQNNPNNWSNPHQAAAMPVKKPRTWMWAVGILGVLVLLCGGGLIGFVALVANVDTENSNIVDDINRRILNSNSSSTNSSVNAPKKNSSAKTIDLNLFDKKFPEYGSLEVQNDELVMSSKRKGTYFVIVPTVNYKTENAVTKITVRNINQEDTDLGFGLVFHSATTPLKQDYAFLIDSEGKKYRVVKHADQKETDEIKWTKSSAIKDGTQENVLEMRDEDGSMKFFINGEAVNSLKNTDGYKGGVSGLYAADAIPVAFSQLEISN